MRKLFIYTLLLIFSSKISICQTNEKLVCNVTIFLKEYDEYIYPHQSDSLWFDYKKTKVTIQRYNCEGKMIVKEYNKKSGKLMREGAYCESLDTLKGYIVITDDQPPFLDHIEVYNYFQPLKDGVWRIYSKQEKLLRSEIWKKGILER